MSGWEDARARLADLLGGPGVGRLDASEWVLEALERRYGVADESELDPEARHAALCRVTAAVAQLAGDDLAFVVGVRGIVAAAFRRVGLPVEGPPWRLDPTETARPTREAWLAAADFASPPERCEDRPPNEPRGALEDAPLARERPTTAERRQV